MSTYTRLIALGPGVTVSLPGRTAPMRYARVTETDFISSGIVTQEDVVDDHEGIWSQVAALPGGKYLPLLNADYKILGGGQAIRIRRFGLSPTSTPLLCPDSNAPFAVGYIDDRIKVGASLAGSSASGEDWCDPTKFNTMKVRVPIRVYNIPCLRTSAPDDDSYVGKINDGPVTINGKSHAAYTLLWDGYQAAPDMIADGTTRWPTSLRLTYKKNGWYKGWTGCIRWVQDDDGNVVTEIVWRRVLEYDTATFPSIGSLCNCATSSSTGE